MMMKTSSLFLLLFLSSTVSGLGSVLQRSYTQIQQYSTWINAQMFCRSYYSDLAVLYTQSDADNLPFEPCFSWIGLNVINNAWLSADGNWFIAINSWWGWNPQSVYNGCVFVTNNQRFYVGDCEGYQFFICHEVKDGGYKYTFINQSKTWSDAQQYCSSLTGPLVQYNDLISAANLQDFPVWIGLYRDGKTWQWSTGESDYRHWAPNQPGDSGDCVAINSRSKTMTTQSCSAQYPFMCFRDNLVLVKENKTWEEAVDYCRSMISQNNIPNQLVSVQPGDYSYMMSRAMEADTDEVWTGLRFLAGYWMWVNGADMSLSDLPLCPVSGLNCGVFSKNDTGSLQTRDCAEKKNFLCYSLWSEPMRKKK